ncbi:MAG: hypothetical protein CMN78_00250 [Spirochaetales bacterium]|nr:hypothetical protein [Spirochaetales bacterium]
MSYRWEYFIRRTFIPLGVTLVYIVLLEVFGYTLDFRLHDIVATLRTQYAPPSVQSTIAVFIAVDEESERKLLKNDTTGVREVMPDLLTILSRAGASLIVFDFLFIESMPKVDPILRDALESFPQAVTGAAYVDGRLNLPNEYLIDAFSDIGILNMGTPAGTPRYLSFSTYRRADGLYPISFVAAQIYSHTTGKLDRRFRGAKDFWIPFHQSADYFPSFSLFEVLESGPERIGDERNTPLSIFSQKAVFIGYDKQLQDRFRFPNTLGERLPGSFGHLFAFEAMVNGDRLIVLPRLAKIIISICVLLAAVFIYLRGRSLFAWQIVFPVVWFVAIILLAVLADVQLPILAPFGALAIFRISFKLNERMQLKSRLKSAIGFDPSKLDDFRKRTAMTDGRIVKQTAILCADIRGYTTYVKNTSRDVVAQVVGEYMSAMEQIIIDSKGYINKYVGDEIIAVFGFPLDESSICLRAVQVSLAMLKELETLKQRWKERRFSYFQFIGIGVDFGDATFLEVGGRTKRQFDIIGNPINGAARIQALTKELKTPFLVSQELVDCVQNDADASSGFTIELTGTHQIRGMGDRKIYRIFKESHQPI